MATSKKKEIKDKQKCTKCERELTINAQNFWQSDSIVNSNGYLHICSDCINDLFSYIYRKARGYGEEYELNAESIVFDDDTKLITKEVCRYIDLVYNNDAYEAWKSQISSYVESGNGKNRKKLFGNYKAKLSTIIKENNSLGGMTYEFSDSIDIEDVSKQNKSTVIAPNKKIDELKEIFGEGHSNQLYYDFYKKYNFLKENYTETTAMHTEALVRYVKYSVLEDVAITEGDDKKAKAWGSMANDAAKAAKINPNQLSKADLMDGLNSFSELSVAVEKAVDVVRILPRFKYRPSDALDFTIWCYINYERNLNGLPEVAYEDVYKFYDRKVEEYLAQFGDPTGIFTNDTTKNNRAIISEFIKPLREVE